MPCYREPNRGNKSGYYRNDFELTTLTLDPSAASEQTRIYQDTMHNKVDFIVAGTQKGGTSSMDAYLRTHPRISMAKEKKEVHFFNQDRFFQGKDIDYERYHAFFDMSSTSELVGEVTPAYMYCIPCPRRIWDYNSQLKILALLRDPVSRAYSHWNMQRERGIESLSFWDALQAERSRSRTLPQLEFNRFAYTDRGFYVAQLERIWQIFPREQTLILKSEDLWAAPAETLQKVSRFLAVEDFPEPAQLRVLAGSYQTTMAKREKSYLATLFAEEVRNLESLLGWDCSSWLSG